MRINNALPIDELCAIAAARGRYAGESRRADFLAFGYDADELPDWSPLSGEWAGESTPELLGDLLEATLDLPDSDGIQAQQAIEDAYETAALDAYYGEED